MEFTEQQQNHIDTLIKKKYNEAYTKAKTEANDTIAASELKYIEELTTLKGKVESLQNLSGDTTKRLRGALLKAEVAQLQVVDVNQVVKLLNENIITDDQQNLVVVDEAGNRRFTNEGQPLSVKEFVTQFIDENPHHKTASRSVGAGSFGNRSFNVPEGKTMTRQQFDILPNSKKTAFIHSGGRLTG